MYTKIFFPKDLELKPLAPLMCVVYAYAYAYMCACVFVRVYECVRVYYIRMRVMCAHMWHVRVACMCWRFVCACMIQV